MNIDSFSGAPPPLPLDIKLEKKSEVEEPRAIESPSENSDSKLDIDRENINKERRTKYIVEDNNVIINVYNAKGDLVRKIPPGYVGNLEQESINLVV